MVTHPREREWVGVSSGEIDLHRLMAATDFSPGSGLALNYALSMAKEYRAEVHLVHIVSREEEEDPEVVWSHAGLEELYCTSAHRLQHTIPREAGSACKIVTAVRFGKPAEQILSYATKEDIDLICVGASGAGLSLGTMLGSTVDRVLRRAPCPMLVARPLKWAVAAAQAA
jgi:nucleotide-binding universal stress UspA family protein